MTLTKATKIGSSLCFTESCEAAACVPLAAAGIECVEFSFGYDYYMNRVHFPANAAMIGDSIRSVGLETWSLHLPFSSRLDISNETAELRAITLYTNLEMIRAGAAAGCRVIVLHPSSEPVADDRRAERMRLSREAILMLNAECERLGVRLAVENLPRTCLCRTSDEMIELLQGTGAGVVFDTNHSTLEDNIHYIDRLTQAGLRILTLHISDYYRDENGVLDERHCLPGEGVNRWRDLLGALQRHRYDGPLMYEVSRQPKNHSAPISPETLAANMRRLAAGEIL